MAAGKRSFSPSGVPEKDDDYHGGCRFERTTPDVAAQGIKSMNLEIPFDEALRLAAAIQSAVMRLNRYERGTASGREMGLCLSVKVPDRSIAVIETKVRPASKKAAK